jgi:pimeloyl-ACP methyl ester carboxylesterase
LFILGVSTDRIEDSFLALKSFAAGALFAEVFGEGPSRIIALHGWGRRGADFKPALGGLPALAPDLPGFGASPAPDAVIGADGYAELLDPLLGETAESVVLVGHSFGGRVALRLAVRHPDRIGAMVLTGVPLLRLRAPTPPPLGYRVIRWANRIGIVSDEALERRRRQSGSADYRAAQGVMRDILVKVIAETYESELATVEVPVVMMWGSDDQEVPLAVAERAMSIREASGLPASLEVLGGVGHMAPLQAADRLREVVEELIR